MSLTRRLTGQKNIVRANLKLFKEDPNHAVSSGRVGVYSKGKEFWKVETKGDTITTEYPVTEQPPYVIPYTGKKETVFDFIQWTTNTLRKVW